MTNKRIRKRKERKNKKQQKNNNNKTNKKTHKNNNNKKKTKKKKKKGGGGGGGGGGGRKRRRRSNVSSPSQFWKGVRSHVRPYDAYTDGGVISLDKLSADKSHEEISQAARVDVNRHCQPLKQLTSFAGIR